MPSAFAALVRRGAVLSVPPNCRGISLSEPPFNVRLRAARPDIAFARVHEMDPKLFVEAMIHPMLRRVDKIGLISTMVCRR